MQTANITLKDLSFTQSLWNFFLFKLIFCVIAAVAKKQEKWVWIRSFSWFYEKFRNRANLNLSITKEKAFPNFQYMFFSRLCGTRGHQAYNTSVCAIQQHIHLQRQYWVFNYTSSLTVLVPLSVTFYCCFLILLCWNEGLSTKFKLLVSKETVQMRRWESEIKICIKRVDKGCLFRYFSFLNLWRW